MTQRAAVILAAGQGTRMRSPLPKMLHAVGGRTLVDRAIDAAEALGCEKIVVVVGTQSPALTKRITDRLGTYAVAVQDPPLGTAHAVLAARDALRGFEGDVVITNGDHPLQGPADMAPLFALREAGADIAVLGFEAADPSAYGRMLLDKDRLTRIVEAKEATPDELLIKACNTNVMAAPAALLFDLLCEVRNDNAKGEYYLTDVILLAGGRRLNVRAAMAAEDAVMGVNSQAELAQAEAIFQRRRRAELLEAGVWMPAPDTVHFAFDTKIAAGVMVEPYVIFAPARTTALSRWLKARIEAPASTSTPGAKIT